MRVIRLLLYSVLLLVVGAGAYFWATGMIDSTYAYRSALKDNPPQPAAVAFEPASRRVVFVLIDGLRLDTSLKPQVMPVLTSLRLQGASAVMHSQAPSFSEPGYSTLLTGAWPYLNDGPAMNLDYEEIPTFTQDNLFSAASRKGLRTGISAYYWFEKLVPQSAVSVSFYTPGDDRAADRAVVDAALPMLKDPSLALVLIHLDQVDYAGHHEGGALHPNWDAAAARSDALLGEVLAQLDLTRDTLVVCSDHGHIDQGGHGGPDAVALIEPFVITGAAVRPGSYQDMVMVDVAPTLAALLGASLPASTQGRVLVEMLNLPQATTQALPGATRSQQNALVQAYSSAIGRAAPPEKLAAATTVDDFQTLLQSSVSARLTAERLPRLLVALLLLVGITWLWLRQNRRAAVWRFFGAGVTIALFHLRWSVLDGNPYSLSAVTGVMDLIVYLAVTAAVSLTAGWLLVCLGLGIFRRQSVDAFTESVKFILMVLSLLLIPVMVHFVLNGALVGWMLPEMVTAFVALISLIQALVTALLGLLLAGLSALLGRRALPTSA